MPTTLADIHPHILQTHVLQRLDAPSLSATATTSSFLRTLCVDDNLWSQICKSTWPSITHPRLHHVISTFPSGHRSFFHDSFPALTTAVKRTSSQPDSSSTPPDCSPHLCPSELISAVDIRYQDDIVYSGVKFTETAAGFLSSPLLIDLHDDAGISRSIDLKVNDIVDADDETISHLKEHVTLNWILIDPTRKRAVNLSSIKPVLAWITNDIHLRYVVVLPGVDPNKMVECRIEVTLVMGKGGVGLQVRKVALHIQDEACNPLSGKEFLVITQRANLEKSEMVMGCEVRDSKTKVSKSRDKMGRVKKTENKSGWVTNVGYVMPVMMSFLVGFCFMI